MTHDGLLQTWRTNSMDHIQTLFERLHQAGKRTTSEREAIYAAYRAEVAACFSDAVQRDKELAKLEKVIRRQEMQALYEDTLGGT